MEGGEEGRGGGDGGRGGEGVEEEESFVFAGEDGLWAGKRERKEETGRTWSRRRARRFVNRREAVGWCRTVWVCV